jgi:hypothetical protein
MSLNVFSTPYLLLLIKTDIILSQPDLCENSRFDSFGWVADENIYFFTSGGYYWYVKQNEMPPPLTRGQPLPNGFKIGESALYLK